MQYYYDTHPTEEDLLGEAVVHANLVHYLIEVLHWHFRGQVCALCDNLNFYRTPNRYEKPVIPDIAVIKGVPLPDVPSWRIGWTGPAPHIVFEIASEETWQNDLKEKRQKYATLGVQEYYVYDPNDPPLWRHRYPRLLGWRLDPAHGGMIEMVPGPDGRLWSPHLESWLVPDGAYLRLYDRDNQRRLTEAEAQAEARQSEARRAEAEAGRAETEARRAEALAEKLRSLGINPDEI